MSHPPNHTVLATCSESCCTLFVWVPYYRFIDNKSYVGHWDDTDQSLTWITASPLLVHWLVHEWGNVKSWCGVTLSRPCMALVGARVSDHHAGWWTAQFISGLVRGFRAMFHCMVLSVISHLSSSPLLGYTKYHASILLTPGSRMVVSWLLELESFHTGYCHMAMWPGSIFAFLQHLFNQNTCFSMKSSFSREDDL